MMAIYLQTQECICVKALAKAIMVETMSIGAIINDGVLVSKTKKDPSIYLDKWSEAILLETSLAIKLAVKPLVIDPKWTTSNNTIPINTITPLPLHSTINPDAWMDGNLYTYSDMKDLWEQSTFKIVKSGNYVREDPVDNSRDVLSEKQITDSYKHLHFSEFKFENDGSITVSASIPFINRWLLDRDIKYYREIVFNPPPKAVSPNSYNIWNGTDVERYTPMKPVNINSEAVLAYINMFDVLCNRAPAATKYLIDWIAQIFQQPGLKSGTAIVLQGADGVGKNRATDLIRNMLGPKDKFFQTASPYNTLYGRFTRLREGKLLIVINEANGHDNIANEIIKDMITCDEFISEGKGSNAHSMNCMARFIITTNNDNVLNIIQKNCRYVVFETSSELKGNVDSISNHIDDPHSRYEFYKYLMARDISEINWMKDRPLNSRWST